MNWTVFDIPLHQHLWSSFINDFSDEELVLETALIDGLYAVKCDVQ